MPLIVRVFYDNFEGGGGGGKQKKNNIYFFHIH
jgi:hypothetical protein